MSYSDVETAMIAILYQSILKRDAEPAALVDGSARLKNGTSIQDIAWGLFSSEEYRTNQINNLCRSILNRDPAPTELKEYLVLMDTTHWTSDDIAILLYDSTDFRALALTLVAPMPADAIELLREINQARAANIPQLPPMVFNSILQYKVAQPHANAMAQNNIQSHDAAGDGDFLSRIEASGYGSIGGDREILATGSSVADAMGEWRSETPPNNPHWQAIMSNCTEAGCASATATSGLIYFSCAFGRPSA